MFQSDTEGDAAPHGNAVLFAYDGSELAREAIHEASRALRPGPALVVTVWQRLETIVVGPIAMIGSELERTDAKLAEAARRTADEGTEIAAAAGFEASAVVELRRESVWSTILDVADDHDAALIVLGSHGRSGISYVLKGSVATAVSQHARRPVLVVPPPDLRTAGTRDEDLAHAA